MEGGPLGAPDKATLGFQEGITDGRSETVIDGDEDFCVLGLALASVIDGLVLGLSLAT